MGGICPDGFIGFAIYSCANKGYPEGGPKDVTPPHVVEERPASFNRNFDKKASIFILMNMCS